jgi:hypothetical protein
VQARNVAARFALRHWYDCDPDVVLAWGSDGASPDGYGLDDARALAAMAALCGGPFLLADDLAALTPAERSVLEDPTVLDVLPSASGAGFRPLDLFDRPESPPVEHAFAAATGIPEQWVAERDGRVVTASFAWHAPAGEPRVRLRVRPGASEKRAPSDPGSRAPGSEPWPERPGAAAPRAGIWVDP